MDFDHGRWNSLMADLELQPMPAGAMSLALMTLSDENLYGDDSPVASYPAKRLRDAGLIIHVGGVWVASPFLRSIEARGLMDKVFAA